MQVFHKKPREFYQSPIVVQGDSDGEQGADSVWMVAGHPQPFFSPGSPADRPGLRVTRACDSPPRAGSCRRGPRGSAPHSW